jgi:hypothetical protein
MATEDSQVRDKPDKRIVIARAIIFVLAGLCLLAVLFSILVGIFTGVDSDTTTVLYSFGSMGLLYLLLGLASISRPFAPMLIAFILNTFLLIIVIGGLINANTYHFMGDILLLLLVIQLTAVFFLVRGLVPAWKHRAVN